MWAVITNTGLVAKDFPTKPAALSWIKQYNNPTLRPISQNSKEFQKYERGSK